MPKAFIRRAFGKRGRGGFEGYFVWTETNCQKDVSNSFLFMVEYIRTAREGKKMSFEFIIDVIAAPAAVGSAIIALFNIILKVNRTIQSLELAIGDLKAYMERQSKKNENFYTTLADHEIRIRNLEYKTSEDKERD